MKTEILGEFKQKYGRFTFCKLEEVDFANVTKPVGRISQRRNPTHGERERSL